jgi:hypothetical protein
MIAAYKAGVPGNGQPFPDGSTIVKLQWKPKRSTEAPIVVEVPDVHGRFKRHTYAFGNWLRPGVPEGRVASVPSEAPPKEPCGYSARNSPLARISPIREVDLREILSSVAECSGNSAHPKTTGKNYGFQ